MEGGYGAEDNIFALQIAQETRQQLEYAALPKPIRLKDEDFLAFVRTYTCLVCRSEQSDAHHLVTGGVGTKGPDFFTVPLCRTCHALLHQIGPNRFQENHDVNLWHINAFLVVQYFTGVPLIKT